MFAHPEKILRAFEIKENMIVADLGAGMGFYSIAVGKMVPKGRVYAIEIQKDFLETIRNKIKEAHLDNVDCLWGNVEKIGGTKLSDESVDRIIISDVLFQVEDKKIFIDEVRRILKHTGKILLIDHDPFLSHLKVKTAVSKEEAKKFLEKGGFSIEREIDAGEHHYGMIIVKK